VAGVLGGKISDPPSIVVPVRRLRVFIARIIVEAVFRRRVVVVAIVVVFFLWVWVGFVVVVCWVLLLGPCTVLNGLTIV
jgi:hypothetical protein